jgi:hypothetical protein
MMKGQTLVLTENFHEGNCQSRTQVTSVQTSEDDRDLLCLRATMRELSTPEYHPGVSTTHTWVP